MGVAMPAGDIKDPGARTAQGLLVRDLYCPRCDHYSGGGLCRVCASGFGTEFNPPVPVVDLADTEGDNDG